MKRTCLSLVVAFAAIGALMAQDSARDLSPWSMTIAPAVAVPFMAGDGSGAAQFSAAWGGNVTAEYALHSAFPLALRLGAGYSIGGLQSYQGVSVPGSVNEFLFLAGASTGKDITKSLFWRGFIDAGLAYGSLSGTSAAYAAAQAGAGIGIKLSPTMAAGLDIAALYKAGLYGAVGAQLGLRYAIPVRAQAGLPAKPRLLELRSISMQSVFPVLRSYYDQNPVGSAKIVNTSKETANNVRVSFIVKQYMGAPEKQTRIYRRKR